MIVAYDVSRVSETSLRQLRETYKSYVRERDKGAEGGKAKIAMQTCQ
jgi:hypothetical protein